jgi:hypothetical protein
MAKVKRLLLGILLGAVVGAALTVGIIYALPESYRGNFDNYTAPSFFLYCQFVFGSLFNHPIAFFVVVGGAVGAVAGIFRSGVVPHPKICLGILLAFIIGFVVSAMVIYRPGKNILEWGSAIWGQNAASERAWAYFRGLQAMDQMTTNHASATKFQAEGRAALANYLHETESREQIWKGREPIDFMFTNSGTYHIAQKYLATHPDVVQTTNLPNLQTNSPPP